MTPLRDRLGPIGARLRPGAGGTLRAFLAWWAQALASWLPAAWREALGMDRGRLLLHADGDDLTLRLHRGAGITDLGTVPGLASDADLPGLATPTSDPLARVLKPRVAELPRWLFLPAASALRRRLVLPAAAADRLRDVVGFEIDRQTPFAPADVAFDARVLGRRESDGQLDVELVAMPRNAIAPQTAALGPLAGTLAGIDVAAADGAPLGVNLLAPADRHRHRDPWRTWNAALAAVAVLACGLMLWQVLQNRRAAADAFEQRIAAQAQAGRRAAAARQQLNSLVAGQAFLDRARAERPVAVEVIDELARRLPDDTYLEKLSIEGQRLMLIGLSNEAAALVGRLQGSALWRSPALAGALQPDPASGRDRFTLTAELVPSTPAPASAAPRPTPEAADADASR